MSTKRLRFAVVLPVFSVVVWVLLVLLPLPFEPLLLVNGNGFAVRLLRLWLSFPGNGSLLFALAIPVEQRSWIVMALNLPGTPGELLVSIGSWPSGWHPAGMSYLTWRMLSFPVFALPGWFYAGRGIDALRSRTVLCIWDMIAGSLLSALCAFLCGGLELGLSATERDESIRFFTSGLALWAVLFGIVAVAAVQRGRPRLRIVVQVIAGLIFGVLILWAWTNSPVPLWEVSRVDGSYGLGWRSSLATAGVAVGSQYLSWLTMRAVGRRSLGEIAKAEGEIAKAEGEIAKAEGEIAKAEG